MGFSLHGNDKNFPTYGEFVEIIIENGQRGVFQDYGDRQVDVPGEGIKIITPDWCQEDHSTVSYFGWNFSWGGRGGMVLNKNVLMNYSCFFRFPQIIVFIFIGTIILNNWMSIFCYGLFSGKTGKLCWMQEANKTAEFVDIKYMHV